MGSGDASHTFEDLARPHLPGLSRFAAFAMGDSDAGDDVVQETLVKAYAAFPRYREEGRFKAWLYQIARRCVVDAVRRRRRQAQAEVPLERTCPSSPAQEEERLLRKETRERIMEAVRELPPEQRLVFSLREFSGLKFREIAQISGAPLGTTLARMRYAVRRLRSRLEEYHAV